jgi:hypothetical protein
MGILDRTKEQAFGTVIIPEGDYTFEVRRSDIQEIRGEDSWVLSFVVMDGEWSGADIVDFTRLTEDMRWKINNLVDGLWGEGMRKTLSEIIAEAEGQSGIMTVVEHEYGGVVSNRITHINGHRITGR